MLNCCEKNRKTYGNDFVTSETLEFLVIREQGFTISLLIVTFASNILLCL